MKSKDASRSLRKNLPVLKKEIPSCPWCKHVIAKISERKLRQMYNCEECEGKFFVLSLNRDFFILT